MQERTGLYDNHRATRNSYRYRTVAKVPDYGITAVLGGVWCPGAPIRTSDDPMHPLTDVALGGKVR
jgi:hypothetical protein